MQMQHSIKKALGERFFYLQHLSSVKQRARVNS